MSWKLEACQDLFYAIRLSYLVIYILSYLFYVSIDNIAMKKKSDTTVYWFFSEESKPKMISFFKKPSTALHLHNEIFLTESSKNLTGASWARSWIEVTRLAETLFWRKL